MKQIWQAIDRFLRGPFVSRLLRRCGIDPRQYWLLMDLFGQLSERRETLGQLGHDGLSLKKAAWLYSGLSALLALMFRFKGPATLAGYMVLFLALTAFLLFTILLAETSNSLVNPIEGLVLAHQPIDGATYTAAKLTHLLRILLYLVPGLNVIPALAGATIPGCPWYYPLVHLLAAFAVGLVVALFCCAIFGWLIRFVPPSRLKAAGHIAQLFPWVFYMAGQFTGELRKIHRPDWLPSQAGPLRMLAAALAAIAIATVVLGIRALSGDYLVRVAAIAHGGSGGKARVRRSRLSGLVARWFGGPPARAAFEYLSRMMLRDWQFRRQMIPLIPMALVPIVTAAQGMRTSPFSGKFTAMHLFPHAFGITFYVICSVLVFGSDYKGAWLFLLAPAGAFHGFARGVYARLLTVIAAPHVLLLAVLAWYWGIRDAALFTPFSAAVAAVYLGLELRLIEGMPFSRQPEAGRDAFALPMMLLGGTVMGIAVGLQYLLIFRSPAAVVAVTAALAGTAWFVTRGSLETFEVAIRFHLGMLSTESKGIYTEVEV